MMDQGQHRQPQGPRVDNDDNAAGGPFNFSNHSQQDDYNSFFNNDGNPPSYSWDPTPVIDPRIQPNGFSQTPATWHQNSLNPPNSHQTPNYGLHSPNYANSFSTYAGFQQQHHYPTQTYDTALGYGTSTLLEGSTFDEHVPQEYERPSAASQTISPSALQTFSPYSQFPNASEDQSQTFRNGPQTSLRGGHSYAPSLYPVYDDQQAETMAAILPNGSPQGHFLLRDPAAVSSALRSTNLTGHVFLSSQDFMSDDPRAILPKHSRRRSTKDLKRQILAIQGDKPWSDAHKPLAKRLKLSHPKKGRTLTSGASAASGAQTAGSETSSPSSSASGSDDDSDYDSDSDAAAEKDEPSPLPATRPADPKKAIEYDVIKCVWFKRSAHVTAAAIRTALGDYWNTIKRVRDNWKTEMAALQEAEEKKDDARAERRRSRATEQRNTLENIFRVTLLHGHPDIVEKLGEIPQLLLTFSQLVTDRFKEGDYSGHLVATVLQLMARCTTMDQSLLERTKLDKVLPKLVKRGDDKIKSLGQQILDNAEQSSKQKPAESRLGQTVESKAGVSSTQGRASELAASLKRQRDAAPSTVVGVKKGSISKPGSSVSTKTGGSLTKASFPIKGEAKSSTSSTTNSIPAKVKVNHVVAKPSVFSSLQSASKKPGTSIAAQKAAQQNDGKPSKPADNKPPATSVAAAAAKPAFSFSETMANLTKPKEVPTAEAAESGPPETEEEKKKRVRREERRKLRVKFKPDNELAQIRLFVHDPEEELGHDESMTRDVGDISSEGRMLKMHKEREVLDDEDEYSPPEEEELAAWRTPTCVDFSVIDPSELARNCVSRGGKVEVKSPERAVQEQRELTTLMAYYTSLADTPPSPREPTDPYSGEPSIERMFGAPQEETKRREAQYYASLNHVPRATNPPVVAGIQAPDISALLQILNSQQQQQPMQLQQQYQMAQPQHQPQPQPQPNGLEAIFAQFSGTQPVAPQSAAPQPVANPQLAMFDPAIQAALATLNLQNPVQPNYMTPAPAQAQTPDLQALLSRLGAQPSAPPQNYNYQSSYQNDGGDRKRPYDYDDQRQNERYSDGKRVRGNLGKKFYGVPSVPCKFWHEGKCKKGDECTFLHE